MYGTHDRFLLSRETAEKLRRLIDKDKGTTAGYQKGGAYQQIALVECGAWVDSPNGEDQLYDGTVWDLNAEQWEWESEDGDCYLTEANGLTLCDGTIYLAIRKGVYDPGDDDDRPVFIAVATVCKQRSSESSSVPSSESSLPSVESYLSSGASSGASSGGSGASSGESSGASEESGGSSRGSSGGSSGLPACGGQPNSCCECLPGSVQIDFRVVDGCVCMDDDVTGFSVIAHQVTDISQTGMDSIGYRATYHAPGCTTTDTVEVCCVTSGGGWTVITGAGGAGAASFVGCNPFTMNGTSLPIRCDGGTTGIAELFNVTAPECACPSHGSSGRSSGQSSQQSGTSSGQSGASSGGSSGGSSEESSEGSSVSSGASSARSSTSSRSSASNVSQPCCPLGIPSILYVSWSGCNVCPNNDDCSCASSANFTINYSGSITHGNCPSGTAGTTTGAGWTGSGSLCGNTITVNLWCAGTAFSDLRLDVWVNNDPSNSSCGSYSCTAVITIDGCGQGGAGCVPFLGYFGIAAVNTSCWSGCSFPHGGVCGIGMQIMQ